MPCVTYLSDSQIKSYSSVTDTELNELFQEVRKIDDNWLVEERIETIGFFKKRTTINYHLYYNLGGEVQVIFLASGLQDNGNKDIIMLYFYGFLNGYRTGMRNK